jgi:hypothetical protein
LPFGYGELDPWYGRSEALYQHAGRSAGTPEPGQSTPYPFRINGNFGSKETGQSASMDSVQTPGGFDPRKMHIGLISRIKSSSATSDGIRLADLNWSGADIRDDNEFVDGAIYLASQCPLRQPIGPVNTADHDARPPLAVAFLAAMADRIHAPHKAMTAKQQPHQAGVVDGANRFYEG